MFYILHVTFCPNCHSYFNTLNSSCVQFDDPPMSNHMVMTEGGKTSLLTGRKKSQTDARTWFYLL